MATAAVEPHSAWFQEKFQVLRSLGSGHYGKVYSIKPKRPSLRFPFREACACKFQQNHHDQEAEVMRQLKHVKGVVCLKEYHEEQDESFLLMEQCECDLVCAVKKGLIHLNEVEIARIILSLARTIKGIHSKGIVHRDLKLQNILLARKSGEVKIGDFGSATYCGLNDHSLSEIAGTISLMAPEVYRGSYGREIDIYNLGLVFFSLIENAWPFLNVASTPAEADEILRFEQASRSAQELILRMTCGNPKNRMTVDEIIADPWLHTKAKMHL